jgi:DNA processing protein
LIALRPDDARYPVGVRDLTTPPDPLWVDGDASALAARSIAIVGTRRMTGYGERVARELALACAAAGVVVVSGFAQGIDTAAHRGALDGGGRTIAVLGESIPAFVGSMRGRRRPLVPRVRAHGALVSQYAAPIFAQRWTFARRNATIAAIASACVVVEAGEASGALITAADARRLGRPVYAVPGPLGSSASVGTNSLIASGLARALTSADDLVRGAVPRDAPAPEPDALLDALRDGPLGVDELARRSRLSPSVLAGRLALLVLGGAIRTYPDGRVGRSGLTEA